MSELGFEPRVDSFYSQVFLIPLFPRSLHVETHPLVHPYPALLPRDFPPPWPRALRSLYAYLRGASSGVASEHLSPCTTTIELVLRTPEATTIEPTCHNY